MIEPDTSEGSGNQMPFAALVVDDDPGIRQSFRLCLEAANGRVQGVGSVEAAFDALDRTRFDIIFLDVWLGARSGIDALPEFIRRAPEAGIVVITAYATFESVVESMRRGAVDYLPKPSTPDQVRLAARRFLDSFALRRRLKELEARIEEGGRETVFETSSPAFQTFLKGARRAAASDCVILLRGESGTGKNVLARWIRANSSRDQAPYVVVNCPDLSSELMSSILFGHRKGAFTGAFADVTGKVQEAEGGTLFLDEIGDLSMDAQVRLLRFLNDRSFERVGDPRERQADVRLIAATNRPIEDAVRSGRFREDLLYRLNVVTLALPPLRERREDVVPLARHYLEQFAKTQRRGALELSEGAHAAIEAHHWPGNLRELRNAVERAVILSPSNTIDAIDLGLPSVEPARAQAVVLGGPVSLEEIEREHIARVIARSPTLESAARTLSIDATTLQRKRKRYGLI